MGKLRGVRLHGGGAAKEFARLMPEHESNFLENVCGLNSSPQGAFIAYGLA